MSVPFVSDREAKRLRDRIQFLTRDGGYRTVITDSESADGIAARCASPEHPEFDRERQWEVHDCCDTKVIETGHEHMASLLVDSMTVIPKLLGEREQLRAQDLHQRRELVKRGGTIEQLWAEKEQYRAQLVDLHAVPTATRRAIYDEISAERDRQDAKFGEQNHPDGIDTDDTSIMIADQWRDMVNQRLANGTVSWTDILFEEAYEAGAETDPAKLRAEIVQIAAVAVAWLECIDRRTEATPTTNEQPGG